MPGAGSEQDRQAMALGAAYLFGAGATLVIVTLLLPHSGDTNDVGVLAMALLAYVVVSALLLVGRRIPVRGYEVTIALGGVLVSGCVLYGGDSSEAYALMYVWVALYAFYFFDLVSAVVTTGFAMACYAAVLAAKDVSAVPSVAWLMAAGTVFVAGTLVARLVFEIRAHNRDLAIVVDIANGMTTEADVRGARDALCATVRGSLKASAVALLERGPDAATNGGGTLRLSGRAGEERLVDEVAGRVEVTRTLDLGETAAIERDGGALRGRVAGCVFPVQIGAQTVGALAVVWEPAKRRLDSRTANAAMLFAAEAGVVIERAHRLSGELERRALELNDNIMQGLVAARYALDAGRTAEVARAVDETMARARRLMSDQLDRMESTGTLRPGSLVRDHAADTPES